MGASDSCANRCMLSNPPAAPHLVRMSSVTTDRLNAALSDRYTIEREIGEGSWITAPVDPLLILDCPPDEVWNGSLQSVGIDPAFLVPGGNDEA